MKGIDLFCASPASTAICVSIDSKSMVLHSGRAIDRQTPLLIDNRRRIKPSNPCTQSASKPKSYHHQKSRKSSAKQTDLSSPPGSTRYLLDDTRRKSSVQQADLLSPPRSTRFLLDDTPFFDVSNYDRALVPLEPRRCRSMKEDESAVLKSSSTRSHDQVVILRVSLHCKGCEAKVRKHISRMEGVRSFSIDFSTKKVTVMGDVTPLGVLTSVSKVKNAQFWPSSSPSTSSSSSIS